MLCGPYLQFIYTRDKFQIPNKTIFSQRKCISHRPYPLRKKVFWMSFRRLFTTLFTPWCIFFNSRKSSRKSKKKTSELKSKSTFLAADSRTVYTLFDENIENHACSLALLPRLLLIYIDFDKWSQRSQVPHLVTVTEKSEL
jgi:hypothetical protein